MKRYLFYSLAILFAFSCSDNRSTDRLSQQEYIDICVRADYGDTKTSLSGTTLSWLSGDKIGIFAESLQYNSSFVNVSDNFYGSFIKRDKQEGSVRYIGYYPYRQTDSQTYIIAGELPISQKAPFDPNADYIVSDIVSEKYDESDLPSLTFHFDNHLFSFIKVPITNSGSSAAEYSLNGISIKAKGVTLAGDFTFNVYDAINTLSFTSEELLKSDEVKVDYDADERPVLGSGEIHNIYAVVNSAAVTDIELCIYTSGGNYTKTISLNKTLLGGHITSLDAIDVGTLRPQGPKTIVLWGDSMTGASLKTAVQSELGSDWIVVRGGVAGDQAYQVAARQGGLPIFTRDTEFTIPASSDDIVDITDIYARENESSVYKSATTSYTFKSGYSPLLNPVIINGIECEINYDEATGHRILNRCEDGEATVVAPRTPVSSFGARKYASADVIVVYIGANARPTDDNLISLHNTMKAHLTNPDATMIVNGFHMSTTDFPKYWSESYVSKFTTAFGDCFNDLRTLAGGTNAIPFMKALGQISDESEITELDWTYINRGDWPLSWHRSPTEPGKDVHPNDQYGAKVIAKIIRQKMSDLGLL